MQNPEQLAAWPRRWAIYLHEMFQPGSRLIFSLLNSLGLSWGMQALQGKQALSLGPRFVLASATVFLILLYYRLCDEFKDLETDREHFPDRPVPSGRVLLKDLRAMQWTASALACALNLLWPLAFYAFLAFYLFAWLMGKWFFMPKIIGENRLLAFLTHGPISLFGSFYIIDLFTASGSNLITLPHLMLALWFAMPGFAWEIGRKTRSPEHEEAGYQIYSTMLGFRGAASLPPLFALTELGIGCWLTAAIALPGWWMPLLALITLCYGLIFVCFMFQPLRFEAWLKPASEGYTVLLLAGLPLAMAQGRGVIWWSVLF